MGRLRTFAWLFWLALSLGTFVSQPSVEALRQQMAAVSSEYAPGVVIVGYTDTQMLSLQAAAPDTVATIPDLGAALLHVPEGQELAAVERLRRDPRVAFAELDYVAYAAGPVVPDDPDWPRQWGPQKVGASEAWGLTLGSPRVVLAVLDTGIALDHPDLASRLWINEGEVPGNGVDDDGNGYIDDIHGWHYYQAWQDGQYVPSGDGDVDDDNGHGTHVAGIAGAAINNGLGIAGMAGNGRLMAVKVLAQSSFGYYSDVARGITYAVDNGAQILNLSLGGKSRSDLLQMAVDYAHERGALLVAAAGNGGGPVLYPAACEHVLAVGFVDREDRPDRRSNRGLQLDVVAPGVDIYSTWPLPQGYSLKTGSSMAAPHVSGLAALVEAVDPSLSPVQLTYTITNTAVDVLAPGWDEAAGWGRIDAEAALTLPGQQLYLSKRAILGPQSSAPVVSYTITFGNRGETATGVVVSDTLPAEVLYVSSSPEGIYSREKHEVVWGPLTLNREAHITATLVVTPIAAMAPCGPVTNTVYLSYDGALEPLVAQASSRSPCRIYLPLSIKDRLSAGYVE